MADSLRTVIGTTLAIGGVLTGVLLLRESRLAPEWLRPPAEPSVGASVGTPALPSLPQPPAATVTVPPSPPSESTPWSGASAAIAAPEASAPVPQPVASASAGRGRKPVAAPAGGQPAEPEVVELPPDFRYSPQGPGNLTFPVAPATASTATGQAR